MVPEAMVFQQDPFIYNLLDFGGEDHDGYHETTVDDEKREHKSTSSTKNYTTGDGGGYGFMNRQKKRRRTRYIKKNEDIEMQRMTHIAVERNRRKQMNEYLTVLKSIMPASYVQRGDQASVIGGAINFVKELEQLLQSLEAKKKLIIQQRQPHVSNSSIFSDFFLFPQYSSNPVATAESTTEQRPHSASVADVEVAIVESHASIKVMSKKQPKQLLKMVAGMHSLNLYVLHLNVTTAQDMMLQSFSVKIEDNCQLKSVNEIARAVYEIVTKIQQESSSS